MKVKKFRFSRLISILSVILGVIIILNLSIMLFTVKNMSKTAAERYSDQFQGDITGINDNLSAIQSMMIAELSSDNELDKLLEEKGDRNLQIDSYSTIKRLNTLMANWSRDLHYNIQYAIYLPTNKIEMYSCVQESEYTVWRSIKTQLYTNIETLHFKSGWQVMNLNNKNYLVSIVQKNSIISICYIDLQDLIAYLQKENYGKDYFIAFSRAGTIYEGGKELNQNKIDPDQLDTGLMQLGSRSMADQELLQEKIAVTLVVHNYNNEAGALQIQVVMWGMLGIVVFMVILFIGVINRTILSPILKFNQSVESYKNDETYDLKAHYQMKELENASDLMHDLLSRIKKLKIDIYEKTLEQQKTKMDFLTLQIEPHFYLNCLNNIFSMAQMRQYADIQKFATCVSVYLRYIFKSSEELVSIQDEIYHIEKYLEIQKMRYHSGFSYQISLEDSVLQAGIPPLILQTFVENSLKHTVNWEDDIELSIRGRCVDEHIFLTIQDTGEGFSEEVLTRLQKHEDISQGNQHIGIMNAIARLAMTFGKEGIVWFENAREHGAVVHIEIPYRKLQNEGEQIPAVFDEKM